MKKRTLNSKLNFRKRTISNLEVSSLKGGHDDSGHTSCDPVVCTATFNCPPTGVNCGLSQGPNLCEFTFYAACTGASEPGQTVC